jgi:hypothetical protein
MNKCICFKHPTDIPKEYTKRVMSPIFERVKKGDTFTYVMNYEGSELFGLPVRMELYDVNSGRHLFSIARKSFEKFFVDLEVYRDKQIDSILL